MDQGNAVLVTMTNLQTAKDKDITPPGRWGFPWHGPAPPQQHLRIVHLNLETKPKVGRPQAPDEADRVGLGEGHERDKHSERGRHEPGKHPSTRRQRAALGSSMKRGKRAALSSSIERGRLCGGLSMVYALV